MKITKISFKVGSNKIFITVKNKFLRADEVIKKVVKKLKLQSFDYDLFERANGVDRLISNNEDIFSIWQNWVQSNLSTNKNEFIIKKRRKVTSSFPQNSYKSNKILLFKYNCQLNTNLVKQNLILDNLNDQKLLIVCSKIDNAVCHEYFYFS